MSEQRPEGADGPLHPLVGLTPRERELIGGMIAREYEHAARCKEMKDLAGGEHHMADKQIAWDMERVDLLEKLRDAVDSLTPNAV